MANVISEEQRNLNKSLHQDSGNFGNREDAAGFAKHLPQTLNRLHELGACDSFLDYGTGKGRLVSRLNAECNPNINIQGYDPAVEKFSQKPNHSFDIVSCLDVLEHIEMASIDAVLNDIFTLTNRFCYLVIDLQPAVKTMQDGRNAHILLAPSEWWIARISQLFPCINAFPAYHACGIPQKLVVTAAKSNENLSIMYSFIIKEDLFGQVMTGGVLHKKYKQSVKSK